MKRLFSRSRGQIVIPALFVFPSLMLFIYLIYETAKLSREKIRHQFAIDAAAFVEMTNYSDFLNRTAYVNGAFPMRIFNEGFDDGYTVNCDKKTSNCAGTKLMREILYENGVYPRSENKSSLDSVPKWDIRYHSGHSGKNDSPPVLENSKGESIAEILTWDNAHDWWINWDEANSIYKLYVQIYQLLGSVEEAQYSVLQRLSAGHNFLQKSYWLNTGDPIGESQEAVSTFRRSAGAFKALPYCYEKINFYGNKPVDMTYQGWQEYSPTEPVRAPYMKGCHNIGGDGLFQVMWVDPREIEKMRAGYEVIQHWTAPKNYFNVDFNTGIRALNNGKPMVHTRVTCGEGRPAPSIWPDPTPKFQVRLYP